MLAVGYKKGKDEVRRPLLVHFLGTVVAGKILLLPHSVCHFYTLSKETGKQSRGTTKKDKNNV